MSIPPRTIRRDTRVFISAVTRELGSIRQLVKKGLEDNDYHAVEQNNFPPDYRDLKDKLRERIDSCDAVVHIAGHCYGAEPPEQPADAPRRSYTQLEYDIAVELGKPVYVFLTGANFPADPHDPEPAELQELQEAHRQRLTSTGQDYNPTASTEQLDQKIRSLQLKVERLEEELQQVDQKVDVTGGRLRRWLVAVAVLVVAGLGALGYVGWRQQVEHRAQQDEQARQQRNANAAGGTRQAGTRTHRGGGRSQGGSDDPAGPAGVRRAVPPATVDQQGDHGGGRPPACPQGVAGAGQAPPGGDPVPDRPQDRPAGHRGEPVSPRPGSGRPWPRGTTTRCSGRRTSRSSKAVSWRCWKAPRPWPSSARRRSRNGTPAPSPRSSGPWRSADPNSATEWQAWTDAAVAAASILHDLARYSEAEPLLRDCLRLREANRGPNSPEVAVVLNNLAVLLQATNRLAEAEPLYSPRAGDRRAVVRPGPPRCRDPPQQPGVVAPGHEPAGGGRAALRRALAIGEKSYGPDHPDRREQPQQPGVVAPGHEPAERRPSRSFAARWRSTRNRTAPTTPTLRSPQQPGGVAPGHEPAGGGRAALSPRAGHRRAIVRPRPPRRRDPPQQPGGVAPGHEPAGGGRAADRHAPCSHPLAFQRSTGHEHPNLQPHVEKLPPICSPAKLAEPEIAARIKAAREGTDKLSPIVPEVERLLGPAKPVADVLSSLDRQYKEQGKPAVYFLRPKEPIAPHLDELLRPNGDGLNAQGVLAFRRGDHADAVVLYEAALELMADQPAKVPAKLITRMNRAAALRELGLVDAGA